MLSREELRKILTESKSSRWDLEIGAYGREALLFYTSFLDTKFWNPRKQCFMEGITEHPKCVICGKPIKLHGTKTKMSKTCSTECGIRHRFDITDTKSPFASKSVRDKAKATFVERYGTDNPGRIPAGIEKNKNHQRAKRYDIFIELLRRKGYTPHFTKEQFLSEAEHSYTCNNCGNVIVSRSSNEQHIRCACRHTKSDGEMEIYTWLKSVYNGTIIQSKRFSNKELDIYLPELNLGIEFNGLYWHRVDNKGKGYHRDKYLYFKSLDITLVQVFENEWRMKTEIVKSVLLGKLAIPAEKVYARKCSIRDVDPTEAELFCITNHLQGYAQSSVRLGLFRDGELVQLLTFGRSRYNKAVEWELIRSCSKLNMQIVGGFERLFKAFVEQHNPKSIVSYCDNRWFNGGSYAKSGFTMDHESDPDYFYVNLNKGEDQYIFHHRTRFQKHKLPKLLKKFDESLSEKDNMLLNGYVRIDDAGNRVFIWKPAYGH